MCSTGSQSKQRRTATSSHVLASSITSITVSTRATRRMPLMHTAGSLVSFLALGSSLVRFSPTLASRKLTRLHIGYDASAHLAEETHDASITVAKGMWMSTFSSWVLSVPTLIIVLFCIQDFEGIISAEYSNNFAEYLVQLVGPKGAVAVLSILWVDSTCCTASCFMSAQRVTFAISRDGVLPFSKYFRRLNRNKIPVNAALLVCTLSIVITCAVIGSSVAFTAITATSTIATNFSYLIPITARHTVGQKTFKPAEWNLGKFSLPLGIVSGLYIMFLFCVLLLPQLYPITAVGVTLNYHGGKTLTAIRKRSTMRQSALASFRS